jgi:hypothetical protein
MHLRVLVGSMLIAGFPACGPSEAQAPAVSPQHPLLEQLAPPPVNMPVGRTQVPPPTGLPALPPGTRPALVIISDGRSFRGALTRSGRFKWSPGRVELFTEGASPLQVLYRLPNGLEPPIDGDVAGTLSVSERSDAAGPDRQLVVRGDRSLLLAQIWVASDTPVRADLGDGMRIVQRAVTPPVAGAEVPVELVDGDLAVAVLPPSKAIPATGRTGGFQVLVETSRLTYPSRPEEPRRYILKAWVVRRRV